MNEHTYWNSKGEEQAKYDEMVADQYRYEIEHGYTLGHYDPADFYEVISEFIQQDAEL